MAEVLEPIIKLDQIEDAVADIRAGKVIIVVDDEDRENEGDFICAAEKITPETINFMATHGRGLICTPVEEERANELGLVPMVGNNTDLHGTAFTVSIDLLGQGCSTGISAYDRATGIRHLTNPLAKPSDYARPGHIFPLRAKAGGVLRRMGHTEAAVDLAKMAGLYPAGVLVEILNEDGTMARLPQLMDIAKKHDLRIISIDDLVAYRMEKESLVRKEEAVMMDTVFGEFEVIAFSDTLTGDTHLALKKGAWNEDEPVLVRVHSANATGDLLGTLVKDYGKQTYKALKKIQSEGKGVFVYMRQRENGDSLLTKIRQYKQFKAEGQPEKFSLEPQMNKKDIGVGAQILNALGVSKIRLMTNNPRSRTGVIGYGLEIVENIGGFDV